jgi:L-seryl-tRNA(Ser) seleniumtransferase
MRFTKLWTGAGKNSLSKSLLLGINESQEKVTTMSSAGENEKKEGLDRFGFQLDPSVGYARGEILGSSLDEVKRRQYALRLVQERAKEHGRDSFYNITGLHREYLVPLDKVTYADEWIGPALYWEELEQMARAHLGGREEHGVAIFNRCSAGIIATCLALSKPNTIVISLVPGNRSHPSIARGIGLADAKIRQMNTPKEVKQCLSAETVSLIVITGVSSELEVIKEDILLEVVQLGKSNGVPVLVDDAYGTRLRPIIYRQPKTLETEADIGITSCDKAGLGGPRAGLMVGRSDLIDLITSKASELGMEARSPLALGVWACLKSFDPNKLRREVEFGKQIYQEMAVRFGKDHVRESGLGANIPADNAYEIVWKLQPSKDPLPVAPMEVTAGIGMYWLKRYGIININALGQPGASVWLRFKPDPDEIERFGGILSLLEAVEDGIHYIADRARSVSEMRQLIHGE